MRLVKIFTAGLTLSASLLLAAAPTRSDEPQLVRDIEPRGPRQATVFTGSDQIATANGRTFFRIESIGGSFDYRTAPGKGVRLKLRLPIHR